MASAPASATRRPGSRASHSSEGDLSDRLCDETQEVLRLVAEHDAILATGHVSAAEHLAVAREFGRRGRVVVTHATEDMAGPNLSIAQCRDLADLGCFVELCAMTCIGALATRSVAEMAACIREVGAARVTLGTDYGQKVNPHPAAGLQTYADALWAEGIPDTDIRRMACDNPVTLLGCSAPAASSVAVGHAPGRPSTTSVTDRRRCLTPRAGWRRADRGTPGDRRPAARA